jgi:hypothetical protein
MNLLKYYIIENCYGKIIKIVNDKFIATQLIRKYIFKKWYE